MCASAGSGCDKSYNKDCSPSDRFMLDGLLFDKARIIANIIAVPSAASINMLEKTLSIKDDTIAE